MVFDAAAAWNKRADAGPLEPFGFGIARIRNNLISLERSTEMSLWNLQPGSRFQPGDGSLDLDVRARRRGVEIRFMTDVRGERLNPLLQSLEHGSARITAASVRVIVVDERRVICEGPLTRSGEATAWEVVDPGLRDEIVRVWAGWWVAARTATLPTGGTELIGERGLRVADAMCQGLSDASIADALGLSLRSIQREVGLLRNYLGVTSRTEVVAILLGGNEASTGRVNSPCTSCKQGCNAASQRTVARGCAATR